MMGNIPFEYGDYLIIPRELSIKLILIQQSIDCCMSNHSRQFIHQNDKNESGQHLEHAPFCERDFILPTELETHDEKGFLSKLKKEGMMHEVVYASHPLM
jgi:homogentisate 1,2-dioxygenase